METARRPVVCEKGLVDMEHAEYLAHISDDGSRRERVLTHIQEVAEMAASFAGVFGGEQWAYAAGLAHDIGKYSLSFQRRLLEGGSKCDHSTAGAYELARQQFGWMLSYCVAGHHGGLPNCGTPLDDGMTLAGRIAKAERGELPDYSFFRSELELRVPIEPPMPGMEAMNPDDMAYAMAFRIRMLFSCLVDADYLCTERFILGQSRSLSSYDGLDVLLRKLEKKIKSFYPPSGELNKMRCRLLERCAEVSSYKPGVYSLTVPTGGGKTLASMRFALGHACKHGMRRIIYAAPYTSIIEQNADVYRDLFGHSNVLEHHADFDFDSLDGDARHLRLAAENWDAPLVVTTNVQLLESLHSNKTSRCRKLHNIAGSVIILDEAQMIPTDYLKPCIRALGELVKNYGCTVVLCTATQPALDCFFNQMGIAVKEIALDVEDLFNRLRRVSYIGLGVVDDGNIAKRIMENNQVLCIVNNRKHAKVLYTMVQEHGGEGGVYHLSTLMHPAHRREKLKEIRSRLKDGEPCLVISTSLVEAGVDLDFPVVFRAITGLDSMVQAAGRCNREARMNYEQAAVYLFESRSPYALPLETKHRIGVVGSTEPELFQEGELGDIGAPNRVRAFFNALYAVKELGSGSMACSGLDRKGIVSKFSLPAVCTLIKGAPKALSFPFKDTAEQFKLIADGSYSVVIPHFDIEDDLRALEDGVMARANMRRLSLYAVSVYERDLKALYASGLISRIADDLFLLLDESAYSNETGLNLGAKGGKALYL